MKTPLLEKEIVPAHEKQDFSSLSNSQLLDYARSSLGDYCQTVCKAKCCKKGKLLLTQKETVVLAKSAKHSQVSDRDDGCFDLSLTPQCPSLVGSSCGVYALRPKICRDYPIFDRGSRIVFAEDCEGNKIGLLEAYKLELKKRDVTISDL